MAHQNTTPTLTDGTAGRMLLPLGNGAYDIFEYKDGKFIVIDRDFVYRYNADGSPDTSFSSSALGVHSLTSTERKISWTAGATQSDGKILISGTGWGATGALSVLRLHADGSMDTSFGGGDGLASVYSGYWSDPSTIFHSTYGKSSMVIQPDGKILVAAIVSPDWPDSVSSRSVIARFNPDGVLDAAFGTNGIQEIDGYNLSQLALQDDGKIVISGAIHNPGSVYSKFSVLRLNADGSRDTGFAKEASSMTFMDELGSGASAIAIQPDGKIVAAGGLGYDMPHPNDRTHGDDIITLNYLAMARFNRDGSLDTSFGANGKSVGSIKNAFDSALWAYPWLQNGSYIVQGLTSINIAADGKIVATAYADLTLQGNSFDIKDSRFRDWSEVLNKFTVLRFQPDGKLDSTFDMDGVAQTTFPINASLSPSPSSFAVDAIILADGKILAAGNAGFPLDVAVVKFGTDGLLDKTFATKDVDAFNSTQYALGYPVDVILSHRISAYDADLSAAAGYRDNFSGARISITREGGANPNDLFAATGNLKFVDGRAMLSDTTLHIEQNYTEIGTVKNENGRLEIVFNANATQSRVDAALQSIGYKNLSNAEDARSISLTWTIDDGNTGSQGAGGPSTATYTTQVDLTAVAIPYWIDGLIASAPLYIENTGETLLSSTKTKDLILSYLDASKTLRVKFHEPPSAEYRQHLASEQQQIWNTLKYAASLIDINFIPNNGQEGASLGYLGYQGWYEGARATYPYSEGGGRVYANVFTGDPAAGGAVHVRSLLHELGHALGLKHPFDDQDQGRNLPDEEATTTWTLLAYDETRPQSEVENLQYSPLDIAVLQYLYGPSKTARNGNDTYTLNLTKPNFIWDGAGNDVISAAGITQDITLHLEPGHWDHIGTMGGYITDPAQITVNFGSEIENAVGGNGNDTIIGTAATNLLDGGAGNDRLTGGGGNDTLTGGPGIDTAVYSDNRADYTISKVGHGWSVTDHKGDAGSDLLTDIERLFFADGTLALDIDGNAGNLYRLYKAAFDRTPDLNGLGWQIKALDRGTSLMQIAQNFTESTEFRDLYGASLSNSGFITQLYRNALHREPDPAGYAFQLNALDTGLISRTQLLLNFCESAENQAQVIGLIQNGIEYTYYSGS